MTRPCPGPLTRRGFLQVGALALSGLGLSDLLRLRAEASAKTGTSVDTAVIFIWLPGGPPHHETYDMKPDAPAEYRGDFKPIKTNVPGIEVCELLPRHAKVADKYTLVRSIAHEFADHGGGHKRFLTGRIPATPTEFVNDAPMVGSIVAKMREKRNVGVPNYVAGTDNGRDGVDVFSFGAAYLGPSYTPFMVPGEPHLADFKVRNLTLGHGLADRLDDRAHHLKRIDTVRRDIDKSGEMEAMDDFSRRALELLTSSKARDAFDLSKEPDRLRDRYGRHRWGQRALLARRLVEAGSSFVTMVLEHPGGEMPKDCVYNWDSHAVNCHIFTDLKWRAPYYDQAVTALVEDIYARGLDKRVLLIVTGEFGRTPRINPADGRPGRDHWPNAMSMLVAGGGMRTGQVVGSTTAKGETPKDRPLSPNDLWATMYHHLGIDPETTFSDHTGRPMPILPFGAPIPELLPR